MSLLNKLLTTADRMLNFETASAHCDIPCGIYDPHLAQVGAHTVIRMDMLIELLDKNDPNYFNKYSRYIAIKEEHAELTKHEVRVLWGDYFKTTHQDEFPELSSLVWEIMKLGSTAKQSIDIEDGKKLLAAVQDLAEIFWKTKGKKPIRVAAPYPSGGELVLHD